MTRADDLTVRPGRHPSGRRGGGGPALDRAALPPGLADRAVLPQDAEYRRLRSSAMRGGAPALILRPRDAGEVADAVRFTQELGLSLAVRSGGHGFSGRSTNHGGVVIDLHALDSVEVVDVATRRVRLGPGARWIDVARALEPYGLAISSGDYGGVGVGGLVTAGGIGLTARAHGLTIDHLRAATVVLADGTTVHTDAGTDPELFWGLRGAGANFGVVVSVDLEADLLGDVGHATLVPDLSRDLAGRLAAWGTAVEAAPRSVTSELNLGPRPGGTAAGTMTVVVADPDPETVLATVQPLADVAPLLDSSVVLRPYRAVIDNAAPEGTYAGSGEPVVSSVLVEHLTPKVTRLLAGLLASGSVFFLQLRSVGGTVNDVEPGATAYAHRSANFQINAFGTDRATLDRLFDALRPHATGLYLSFETDRRPERLHDAFPAPTLRRLRALKARVDPGNLFDTNFDVTGGNR